MNAPAKLAISLSISLALLALAPGPASAQQQAAVSQATVDQIVGNAMVSNGGEYTSLSQGATVSAGNSIAVSTDSSVTLNVTDGVKTWQVKLPPGTTTISSDMLMAGAPAGVAAASVGSAGGASITATVASIVGAAAVAAAAESSSDAVEPSDPASK